MPISPMPVAPNPPTTAGQAPELTPTEYLIMEVLLARWRLGEGMWTFPSALRASVRRLESRGLVSWKSGIVEKTVLVWLCEAGLSAWWSTSYEAPLVRRGGSGSVTLGRRGGDLVVLDAVE
jgi:hypothetical protein